MNLFNVKNVQFKSKYVLENKSKFTKHFNVRTTMLRIIKIAERDGAICHCCQSETVFKLHKTDGLMMYTKSGKRMTLDHDMLKSLNGPDALTNMHILCEQCNVMRNSLFAEYAEFKYWYDQCLLNNLSPFKEINKVKRNFCYLDINKNGFKKEQIALIPVVTINTMPEEYTSKLIEHFKLSGSFVPENMPIEHNILIRISTTSWDVFINNLLVQLMKERLNYDLPMPTKQYGLINPQTKKNINQFSTKLSFIIQREYRALSLKAKQDNKLLKLETVKLVNEVPKASWYNALLNHVSKLFIQKVV